MSMFINNMSTDEIINKLSANQKDELYRALWLEHVREDVESHLRSQYSETVETLDENQIFDICDSAARHYVYDGDYDCNLAYWDNLSNLIDNEIRGIEVER